MDSSATEMPEPDQSPQFNADSAIGRESEYFPVNYCLFSNGNPVRLIFWTVSPVN